MNEPRRDLQEMRALIVELLEEERAITHQLGEAVSRGELPLELRARRGRVRSALEDAYAALPILEERARVPAQETGGKHA